MITSFNSIVPNAGSSLFVVPSKTIQIGPRLGFCLVSVKLEFSLKNSFSSNPNIEPSETTSPENPFCRQNAIGFKLMHWFEEINFFKLDINYRSHK